MPPDALSSIAHLPGAALISCFLRYLDVVFSLTKRRAWEQSKISSKPALFCSLQKGSAVMVVTPNRLHSRVRPMIRGNNGTRVDFFVFRVAPKATFLTPGKADSAMFASGYLSIP